jgi:hypothetical protein
MNRLDSQSYSSLSEVGDEGEKRVQMIQDEDESDGSPSSSATPNASPYLLYPKGPFISPLSYNILAVAFKGSSLQQCP